MIDRIAAASGLIWPLLRLRHEAARFVGAGVISYALGLGLSALFREGLRLPEELAVALTLGILFVVNFWMSRIFVFRAQGSARRQFAAYVAAALALRATEYGLFYLILQVAGLHYLAALTWAMVLTNLFKFFLYRALVFGKSASRDCVSGG